MMNLSRREYKKLIAPQLSNRYGNIKPRLVTNLVMPNLVMYCGIIVEVPKALGATFVCATIYNTVEKSGYTNDTHTLHAPPKRTYLIKCTLFVNILA